MIVKKTWGKKGVEIKAKGWKPSQDKLSAADATCPACTSKYTDPVLLPCQHHLCLTCLNAIKELSNMECPLCRHRIGSWIRRNKVGKAMIDHNFQKRIAEIELDDEQEETVRDIIPAKPGEVRHDLMASLTFHERDLEKDRKRRDQEEESLSAALIAQLEEEERKRVKAEEETRKKQEDEDRLLAERLAEERRLEEVNANERNELDMQILEEARVVKEAEERRKKQEEEDFLLAQKLDMENEKNGTDNDIIFLSKSPGLRTFTTAKARPRNVEQSSQLPKSSPISSTKSRKDVRKRLNDTPNFEPTKTKKSKSSTSSAATVTSSPDVQNLITSYFNSQLPCETSIPSTSTRTPDRDPRTPIRMESSQNKNKLRTPDDNFKMTKPQLVTPVKVTTNVSLPSGDTPNRYSETLAATSSSPTATSSQQSPKARPSPGPPKICDPVRSESKVSEWLKSVESPAPCSTPQNGFYKQCSSPTEVVYRNTRLPRFMVEPECEIGRNASDDNDNGIEFLNEDINSPSPKQVAEQEAALKKIQQKKRQEEINDQLVKSFMDRLQPFER